MNKKQRKFFLYGCIALCVVAAMVSLDYFDKKIEIEEFNYNIRADASRASREASSILYEIGEESDKEYISDQVDYVISQQRLNDRQSDIKTLKFLQIVVPIFFLILAGYLFIRIKNEENKAQQSS